jgi:hypothetical protein
MGLPTPAAKRVAGNSLGSKFTARIAKEQSSAPKTHTRTASPPVTQSGPPTPATDAPLSSPVALSPQPTGAPLKSVKKASREYAFAGYRESRGDLYNNPKAFYVDEWVVTLEPSAKGQVRIGDDDGSLHKSEVVYLDELKLRGKAGAVAEDIAARIRKKWADFTQHFKSQPSVVMAIAIDLAEARSEHISHEDFGKWLGKNKIIIPKDMRAALIHMGQNQVASWKALRGTNRRSVELIWEKEILPTLAKESVQPPFSEAPKTTSNEINAKQDSLSQNKKETACQVQVKLEQDSGARKRLPPPQSSQSSRYDNPAVDPENPNLKTTWKFVMYEGDSVEMRTAMDETCDIIESCDQAKALAFIIHHYLGKILPGLRRKHKKKPTKF